MIKALVVEDSAVAREFLVHTLNSHPDIRVVGTASDGLEAVAAARALKPDVVTMDINMPKLNGMEATRLIMETAPTPIIIVTGNDITDEVRATFNSLELGALAIIKRPSASACSDGAQERAELINTVRLMSEVKVVRRWARRAPKNPGRSGDTQGFPSAGFPGVRTVEVVAIGASTGGPNALKAFLEMLRKDVQFPIIIVQHIATGFVQGFAYWLQEATRFRTKVPEEGDLLEPGCVYIAPDRKNIGVTRDRAISLSSCLPGQTLCPSASHLFKSVAGIYGSQAVGIVFTGMGRDGADGLLRMRQTGALTFAQDKESSVIWGMPKEAVDIGAAELVQSPEKIAETLNRLLP